MVKGWRKKRAYDAALVRKQTQLIYGIAGGKENFQKFWPIEEVDGAAKNVMTKRKLDGLFKKAREQAEIMNRKALNN